MREDERAGRQEDGDMKLTVAFGYFANTPKKIKTNTHPYHFCMSLSTINCLFPDLYIPQSSKKKAYVTTQWRFLPD